MRDRDEGVLAEGKEDCYRISSKPALQGQMCSVDYRLLVCPLPVSEEKAAFGIAPHIFPARMSLGTDPSLPCSVTLAKSNIHINAMRSTCSKCLISSTVQVKRKNKHNLSVMTVLRILLVSQPTLLVNEFSHFKFWQNISVALSSMLYSSFLLSFTHKQFPPVTILKRRSL